MRLVSGSACTRHGRKTTTAINLINVSDYTAVVRVLPLAAALMSPLAVWAAGLEPKQKPELYDVHGAAGDLVIGANCHYRSFTAQGKSFYLDGHIVIEVAAFGGKLKRAEVSSSQFTLRVNSGDVPLVAQPASMVAQLSKWQGVDRGVAAQAGPVILGGPDPGPRFPGDRGEVQIPKAPAPSAGPPEYAVDEPDWAALLADAALPAGNVVFPVSGYLYYRLERKLKSVKKLELLYQAEGRALTLRIK
jgi:hypothetical protein